MYVQRPFGSDRASGKELQVRVGARQARDLILYILHIQAERIANGIYELSENQAVEMLDYIAENISPLASDMPTLDPETVRSIDPAALDTITAAAWDGRQEKQILQLIINHPV